MKIIALIAATALAFTAGVSISHAQIEEVTWQGPGTLTYDTNTGLEWLDWTATSDMSYNEVEGLLSSTYAGFSYATSDQVGQLWSDFGLTSFYPLSPEAVGNEIIADLGATSTPSDDGGYDHGTAAITSSYDPYGPGYLLVSGIYTGSKTYPSFANPTSGAALPDGSSPDVGSALVREYVPFTSSAPEPASWLLMIAGVGVVGTMLRRRSKSAPLHHSNHRQRVKLKGCAACGSRGYPT